MVADVTGRSLPANVQKEAGCNGDSDELAWAGVRGLGEAPGLLRCA